MTCDSRGTGLGLRLHHRIRARHRCKHELTGRGADLDHVASEAARTIAELGGSAPITVDLAATVITATRARSGSASLGYLRGMSELHAMRLGGEPDRGPGASFVVAEWRDPGGGDDPPRYHAPLHVHHSDDEAWYVLES